MIDGNHLGLWVQVSTHCPTWGKQENFKTQQRGGSMRHFGLIRREERGICSFYWGQGGVEITFSEGCTPLPAIEVLVYGKDQFKKLI